MPDPITITALSRYMADANGGQMLVIEGDFIPDFGKGLHVHVGPAGDATDPKCLSGIAGQGTVLYPANATKLRCFLPVMPAGGPYNVFVRRVDMTRTTLLLAAMTVLPKMYHSAVFDLRTVLPPYYKTGPRNMDLLEAL